MYRCYKGKLNVNQFWELQTRVQYLQADKRKKRFPLQCLHSVVLDQQMVYSRDFWLMLNDSPCVQLPLCAHRSRRSQKKPPITRYYIVVFANINVYSNTSFSLVRYKWSADGVHFSCGDCHNCVVRSPSLFWNVQEIWASQGDSVETKMCIYPKNQLAQRTLKQTFTAIHIYSF